MPESARQKARFGEDLEAVAEARDEAAFRCKTLDGLHHRGKLGDGAAAKIIAVGETARQDHAIDVADAG